MSIESFDVEPVDHRPLLRWVAGTVALLAGLLAVIGWPLPIPPARYVDNHAWERTWALMMQWMEYPDWRMSASSWFWGGVSVAAIFAVILTARTHKSWACAWLLILLPGGMMATLGPLVQITVGIRWSNYAAEEAGRPLIVVYLICLVAVLGLLSLGAAKAQSWDRKAARKPSNGH